jgi:histidine triad (HIT) family protein
MTFEQKQAEKIKKQLIAEVEKMPNENKGQIQKHIETLNPQQLEDFLKQNNIQITESGELGQLGPAEDNQEGKGGQQASEKPIFEAIIAGELPSYKIAENDKAITILELNPLSKGHSLVIPKKKTTVEKIPKSAMTLAQTIAKRIKLKLKPEDIKIETFSFQDYPAINIIPIYKEKELKKEKAEESELKKLKNKLETKKRASREIKPKTEKKLPEISFRIP